MISIPELIYRMVETADSDPCLCKSGKPFKDCHKLVLTDPKANSNQLFTEVLRIKKKRECLIVNGTECAGQVVKAHSISQRYLRAIMSPDHHVYSFLATAKDRSNISALDRRELPGPDRIGLREMSTFPGLCRRHDDQLFASFENSPYSHAPDQIRALHLRSVMKEIHVKEEAILRGAGAQQRIGRVASGHLAEERNASSFIYALGSNLSLRDLYIELELVREHLSGRPAQELKHICYEVVGMCPLSCSAMINPAFDLHGKLIQNYNDEDLFTRSLSLNVFVDDEHTYFLMTWFDSQEIAAFLSSLFKRMETAPVQWLVQLVFGFSENSCFGIDWFESLSLIKRQRLKKIFYADIVRGDSGRSMASELRNSHFVDAAIAKVVTNWGPAAAVDWMAT